MDLEGSIQITLDYKNKEKLQISSSSTRPVNAASVFHGKLINKTLETLPMLFSVCSIAQARAAFLAWQDATQIKVPETINICQSMLLLLETFREHLWQILIVWPQFVNIKPNMVALVTLNQLIINCKNELFQNGKAFTTDLTCNINKTKLLIYIQQLNTILKEDVLQLVSDDWQSQLNTKGINHWIKSTTTPAASMLQFIVDKNWQSIGSNDINFLPLLNKQQWRTFFSEQQQWSLIKTPTWQQQCLQTSVLTRCSKQQISYLLPQTHPQGILARQLSRLLELVSIPEKLSFMLNEMDSGRFSFKNNKLASGEGLAVVEAARGTLVHWFKMKHNVITDYRILAPTEWNFHPRGVAIKGLESITTASLFKENPDQKNMEILQQQSKLWLSAIDPCVRYQLEIIS